MSNEANNEGPKVESQEDKTPQLSDEQLEQASGGGYPCVKYDYDNLNRLMSVPSPNTDLSNETVLETADLTKDVIPGTGILGS